MNQLLNTKQAADYLSISPAFLERDRWAGARVPFIKIGTRSIRYRLSDLMKKKSNSSSETLLPSQSGTARPRLGTKFN